jgi:hypothetical protein
MVDIPGTHEPHGRGTTLAAVGSETQMSRLKDKDDPAFEGLRLDTGSTAQQAKSSAGDDSNSSSFHELSMAEYCAIYKAELIKSVCLDYDRLLRSSVGEMLASYCDENGVPDIERIIAWLRDFALESIRKFNFAGSTSGDQKSTIASGLPDQASLHFTGTASGTLGYPSQSSPGHIQQIRGRL